MYVRVNDIYIMVATKTNANAMLSLAFLRGLCEVLKSYFGKKFCQRHLESGFYIMYELLDEVCDYGFPQVVDPNLLKQLVVQKSLLSELLSVLKKDQDERDAKEQHARMQVTGAVGWRQDGIKYKKNELYLDIIESVDLIMSAKGQVLRSHVTGKIIMKSFLSGMPEVKIGMNADKVSGVTFHPCVNLNKWSSVEQGNERVISFVPPDGEFELMKYRSTEGVQLPFKVIPVITERGRNRLEVLVKVKSQFHPKIFGIHVQVVIPVPKDTARVVPNVSLGKAKHDLAKKAIVWKMKKFFGEQEHILQAEVDLMGVLGERQRWIRPPIQLHFDVPMWNASGINLSYLRAWERSGYPIQQWVRRQASAGEYTIRI